MKDSEKSILERFSLEGRTALITGGSRGIGHAYAQALCSANASVAILDIDMEKAEDVVHQLTEQGKDVIAIECDVTNEDQVERAVQKIISHWGNLTIGINNAGIGMWSDAETQDIETWRKIIDLNLTGVYICCKFEGKEMMKAGYGKIINTASMSAHISNFPQKQCAYNSSKAGVVHLTRSLASEWAEKGIRVNSISPGYTRTQLLDELVETEIGKKMVPIWLSGIPLGRFAEVSDLQGAAVYLASEASDYLTGSDLVIDGGFCTR